jgi:undecaprenyl-diphosphatase
MSFLEILKAIFLGIIEGITEWLPISSTGHMLLFDEFFQLKQSEEFKKMFFVVVQLGAILAVVILFWKKIFPFSFKEKPIIQKDKITMWIKIAVSCVPAAIIGVLFDDKIDELFYKYWVVAISLIVFGVLFIIIENKNRNKTPKINSISEITYSVALGIGAFQLIAAIFPGTSRSGATILGGIILGLSRTVAAEFTFFLAIPVMFGASLLKLIKFGLDFTSEEALILGVGMIVSFFVSIVVIKLLMGYIKKHDFKVFGVYRIILGALVLIYFAFKNIFVFKNI